MYKEADAKVGAESNPVPIQVQPDISYVVSMSRPTTHLLEVEMRVRWQQMPAQLDLKMPVWTPGSYLVREYARHVQDFGSAAGAGGDLQWEKINKNTWRIQTGGAREVVARYKVYSNELTVRTNELNDEHAFWNNAALLLFPDGQLQAESTITVKPYGNWRVATGLAPVAGAENTFRAPNYDILYDSPFEVSDFKEHTFTAAGKPHRLVITGEGNYDMKQIGIDTAKIANEAVKIFGEMPTDDYLIILNLRGRGGLEHLNSTALQWNRFGFKPRSQYIAFLNLVAHEYFHLWNVKRIRPDALGPFDYENENYTKLLWVAEGTTAYYEGVMLRRAGLVTDREVLETKASLIQALQNRPGRFQTSLEESSLDAWIKYYRQDQNSINNQISYYDKGEIVNMMLDIAIRQASNDQRSLDDVMRFMYDEFYKKNRNFTPADFQQAAEKMAGRSLDDFFARYVSGRAEIDYNAILSHVGLRLAVSQPNAKRAYIGADLVEDAGRLNVRVVASDTPAFEQGLMVGDQIVAIDGHRATQAFLQRYLGEMQPNQTVKLTIFTRDELREIDFRLGANKRGEYSIEPVATPTAAQRRAYKLYLGADL
ncbi:MAG: M61 family metallopeptidase [Blastocatellia bacterium]|nr:M61 family metallopeptidase [Blastocatellia bacterium]